MQRIQRLDPHFVEDLGMSQNFIVELQTSTCESQHAFCPDLALDIRHAIDLEFERFRRNQFQLSRFYQTQNG